MMFRIADNIRLSGAGNADIAVVKRGENNFELQILFPHFEQPSVLSNINNLYITTTASGAVLICDQNANARNFIGSFEIRLDVAMFPILPPRHFEQPVPMEIER